MPSEEGAELHDTVGVWIGPRVGAADRAGVNPMMTVMTLAGRTTAQIMQARAS